MRNSKIVYSAAKETDFNIFMSGPEYGQPIVRACDIVKNMMERRTKRDQEPAKLTAMDVHRYPPLKDGYNRSGRNQLKPMSQSTTRAAAHHQQPLT